MIVYKQYNQEQLNNQYNNRLRVPDFATYFAQWESLSAATRIKHRYIADISYGDHARKTLDIFPCDKPHTKVLVFIHGGYWQMFDKNMFHFIANAFVPYNITTAFINYPLAPANKMDAIVYSTQKAMRWLHQNLHSFNADANNVYVAGHSAGAHLAAMLMTNQYAHNMQFIKGMCLISGLYDLQPIQLSDRNEVLKMNNATAMLYSPLAHMAAQICPLIIAVGASETDEFKAQSRELHNKCTNKTSILQLHELRNLHHFSVLDALVNTGSGLHKAMLSLINL